MLAWLYAMCMLGALRGQKRVLGPLELELQTVSHHRIKPESSIVLIIAEPPLQLQSIYLNKTSMRYVFMFIFLRVFVCT